MSESMLQVEDIAVQFRQRGWRPGRPVQAVDGVSFEIHRGEVVGLVGESGSGKSTLGRVILGLVKSQSGRVLMDDEDITVRTKEQHRRFAERINAVFQDPYGSLNPMQVVGKTVVEPLGALRPLDGATARETARRLLTQVRLPVSAAARYPGSFSGGQRQRIAIARGISVAPELIICDEAVSALDVVTRAQILNLFADLRTELGVALLFIGHDLPVVGYLADRVVVLYQGRVMEQGLAGDLMERPLHPYTRALLAAVPVVDPARQRSRRDLRRRSVSVTTANAKDAPREGCVFAPRCPSAADVCWSRRPTDLAFRDRTVACHLFSPESGHPEAVADPEAAANLAATSGETVSPSGRPTAPKTDA